MNQLIHDHLTAKHIDSGNGLKKESCLTSALRESRAWTNRNRETGFPNDFGTCGYLGHWLGAMGYLTILDQIGKTYQPKTYTGDEPEYKNSIKNALKFFADGLDGKDKKALVALRNAFFHDFSLFNIDEKDNKNHFCFNVTNHPTQQLILHVNNEYRWDGNIETVKQENFTTINLKGLGDLVENIYQKLISLNNTDELIIVLKKGEAELEKRYFFYHNS